MGYELPKYDEMMWPTLLVVRDLGGSATIQEIEDGVAEHMKLSEASLQIEYDSGNGLVFKDRVSWARSHLKKIDALANPSRGIWTLGASAENFTDEAALRGELQSFLKEYHAERNAQTSDDVGHLIEEESSARDWKDELLEVLKAMEPSAFERLCQRVLREHGFSSVRVTGKSGDGGIDGEGMLRMGLLSFHMRFQCKRYRESVRSSEIRDFRGAFMGRADKGLFLTTGRFTRDARAEATRDGAVAVDLIDGEALCDLIREKDLGTTTKWVADVEIDRQFFDGF